MSRTRFCGLTHCASLYVLGDKLLHLWPPVLAADEGSCFKNAGVFCSVRIVKNGRYPPPKVVICHDNQLCVAAPSGTVFPLVKWVCEHPSVDLGGIVLLSLDTGVFEVGGFERAREECWR